MSQRLIVRPVAPTDLAQWEALWEGYNIFYERTVPPEITRWWRRKTAGCSGWCTTSFTGAPR
jgi:murein L,D-transpeptidase YafK